MSEKTMTPEESSQFLIDSINAFRISTGCEPISKELEDQIRASNIRLKDEQKKDENAEE